MTEPDVAALVERLNNGVPVNKIWSPGGDDCRIEPSIDGAEEIMREAAAALTRLGEEQKSLHHSLNVTEEARGLWQVRAEQAEAEVNDVREDRNALWDQLVESRTALAARDKRIAELEAGLRELIAHVGLSQVNYCDMDWVVEHIEALLVRRGQ